MDTAVFGKLAPPGVIATSGKPEGRTRQTAATKPP
jgi:hypothetical protein